MASTIFLDYVMHLQDKQLADEAHWCRQYAKINAVALRKILEQHDRMLHNNSGQRLLQVGLTCCCDRQGLLEQLSNSFLCICVKGCKLCSSLPDFALAQWCV